MGEREDKVVKRKKRETDKSKTWDKVEKAKGDKVVRGRERESKGGQSGEEEEERNGQK